MKRGNSEAMKKKWRNPFYRLKMRKHLKSLHQSGENASHYKKIKLTPRISEMYGAYPNEKVDDFEQHDKSVANEGTQ